MQKMKIFPVAVIHCILNRLSKAEKDCYFFQSNVIRRNKDTYMYSQFQYWFSSKPAPLNIQPVGFFLISVLKKKTFDAVFTKKVFTSLKL